MTLLDVENLWVRFPTGQGMFEAVRGISFSLGQERLGIVGESGSGKSLTGRAILRLIQKPGMMVADHIAYNGENLCKVSETTMRQIRGKHISMVMQDPKFSMNPVMQVGDQITEAYRQQPNTSQRDAHAKALKMLEAVAIRNPKHVMNLYPHEVSGGMGQRIMIAMMLALDPKILIADEPTSALDVSVQRQVLSILDQLVQKRGMGLIFISHDLNLVAEFCDRVLIMYRGRIVEVCQAKALHQAKHPYTRGLLTALPRLDQPRSSLSVMTRDPSWSNAESIRG